MSLMTHLLGARHVQWRDLLVPQSMTRDTGRGLPRPRSCARPAPDRRTRQCPHRMDRCRASRSSSCSTAQAGTVPYMLMADLGAEVIKIEVPEGGDGSRRMTVLPGMPSTFFETNNRGVKSVTLEPEGAGRPRHPAQARGEGRHLRPELPPRRRREERLRLGGAAQGQSEAGLRLDLGLRHQGPERPSAGHRFDGAGAGRHRRGLFHAGPEDAHRHRVGGRRNPAPCWPSAARSPRSPMRGPRVSARRSSCSLLGSPGPADGLDLHHHDVAQPESGDRPGAHHRHRRSGPASAPASTIATASRWCSSSPGRTIGGTP